MTIKITCINKDNGHHEDPHLAISYLGWLDENTKESGKYSRLQMVDFLEKGNTAYVKDYFGNIAYLVVRVSQFGNKFVKTIADGKVTNNLLTLMECK
jgi:hypothetical protein